MDGKDTFTTYTPFLEQYSKVIEEEDKSHGQHETRITEVDAETTDDNWTPVPDVVFGAAP